MDTLTNLELFLLLNDSEGIRELEKQIETKDEKLSALYDVSQQILKGNYKEVLQNGHVERFLNSIILDDKSSKEEKIDDYLELIGGLACLNIFVQINWTGPDFTTENF